MVAPPFYNRFYVTNTNCYDLFRKEGVVKWGTKHDIAKQFKPTKNKPCSKPETEHSPRARIQRMLYGQISCAAAYGHHGRRRAEILRASVLHAVELVGSVQI